MTLEYSFGDKLGANIRVLVRGRFVITQALLNMIPSSVRLVPDRREAKCVSIDFSTAKRFFADH